MIVRCAFCSPPPDNGILPTYKGRRLTCGGDPLHTEGEVTKLQSSRPKPFHSARGNQAKVTHPAVSRTVSEIAPLPE